jgi:Non-ribosomal peptide synthetase modules and related proteins
MLGASQEDLRKEVDRIRLKPFDLNEGPLYRAGRIYLGGDRWCIHYTIHHIVADAAAAQAISEVLAGLMNGWSNDENWIPDIGFEEPYEPRIRDTSKNFFHDIIQKVGVVPTLSKSHADLGLISEPGSIQQLIDRKSFNDLTVFSKAHGGSLLAIFAAALGLYICRQSNSHRASIGYPVSGRNRRSRVIGMMTNTLPLPVDYDQAKSFSEIVVDCSRIIRASLRHQHYPTYAIRQAHRQYSEGPIFSALFSLQNFEQIVDICGNTSLVQTCSSGPAEEINFQLFDFDDGREVVLRAQYNREIYEHHEVERHLDDFLQTLQLW